MLDLVGLLTSPRLFLGGLVGLLVGLGVAFLIHSYFGPQVPVELLALLVAIGIIVGLVIGALERQSSKE